MWKVAGVGISTTDIPDTPASGDQGRPTARSARGDPQDVDLVPDGRVRGDHVATLAVDCDRDGAEVARIPGGLECIDQVAAGGTPPSRVVLDERPGVSEDRRSGRRHRDSEPALDRVVDQLQQAVAGGTGRGERVCGPDLRPGGAIPAARGEGGRAR